MPTDCFAGFLPDHRSAQLECALAALHEYHVHDIVLLVGQAVGIAVERAESEVGALCQRLARRVPLRHLTDRRGGRTCVDSRRRHVTRHASSNRPDDVWTASRDVMQPSTCSPDSTGFDWTMRHWRTRG